MEPTFNAAVSLAKARLAMCSELLLLYRDGHSENAYGRVRGRDGTYPLFCGTDATTWAVEVLAPTLLCLERIPDIDAQPLWDVFERIAETPRFSGTQTILDSWVSCSYNPYSRFRLKATTLHFSIECRCFRYL